MKTVELQDILDNDEILNKTFFHFTPKTMFERIKKDGFKAEKGKNAIGVEENPKVFFVEGPINLLRIADVWIRWIGWNIGKEKYLGKNNENWSKERFYMFKNDFANGSIFTEEIINETYAKFLEMCKSFEYFTLNLEEGKDFIFDDIDEVKRNSFNKDNLSFSPAFMMMYGSYSDFTNIQTDKWNLHTFPYRGVSLDKISHVVSSKYGKDFNMLNMIVDIRRKCLSNPEKKKYIDELVFLNDFLEKTHSLEKDTTKTV